MKFSIEQRELVAALASTKSIVKTTNTIPILGNVLLSVSDDGLHVASTDMSMRVEMNIECDTVEAPGSTTVSAAKLFEITRKLLSTKLINIELDGDVLIVKQGRSRFKLETLPYDQFPEQIKVNPTTSFDIEADTLKRLLSKTIHAVSEDETRYNLNGLYFHIIVDKLNVVGTDGHRLAHIVDDNSCNAFDGFILPKSSANTIMRQIDHASGYCTLNIGAHAMSINCGDVTISSKYIDGTFPRYEQIIPNNKTIARTGKEELLSAVGRVCVLADDKSRRVRLDFNKGTLDIVSVGLGHEEAVDQIDCEFDGELSVAFNSKYLSETLSQLDDGIVRIELGDTPTAPAVFKQDGIDSETFVVMPMK